MERSEVACYVEKRIKSPVSNERFIIIIVSAQCADCSVSFLATEIGEIDVTCPYCDIFQYILIPTSSVARKTLLWTFSWASNSKFAILPQLSPCSNYRVMKYGEMFFLIFREVKVKFKYLKIQKKEFLRNETDAGYRWVKKKEWRPCLMSVSSWEIFPLVHRLEQIFQSSETEI